MCKFLDCKSNLFVQNIAEKNQKKTSSDKKKVNS